MAEEEKSCSPEKETDPGTEKAEETSTESKAETSESASADSSSETKKDKKKKLKDDLEKKQKELDELKDSNLRLMAEYQNYRNRTTEEKKRIYAEAKLDCIKELLNVLDCFERAIAAPCSDENYRKGIEMTHTQMMKSFATMGVTEIVPEIGAPFDPKLHNAIQQMDNADAESDTICAVYQNGYMLGERLIRPAMVAVAL